MKTLRLFGLTLMTILLSVNFTACSEDDEDGGKGGSLVGEWIGVSFKFWESGKLIQSENFEEYGEKIIVEETDEENVYTVDYYNSENKKDWEKYQTAKVRQDKNKLYFVGSNDTELDTDVVEYSISGNKLTIKSYYTEDSKMEQIYERAK